MKTIYLACPYSGTKKQRKERFKKVTQRANFLMQKGYRVFSPITHSHPTYQADDSIGNDHEFWINQDLKFMEVCDCLFVLMLDGWENSRGIQSEIERAYLLGKEIYYLEE